eukprot:UN29460
MIETEDGLYEFSPKPPPKNNNLVDVSHDKLFEDKQNKERDDEEIGQETEPEHENGSEVENVQTRERDDTLMKQHTASIDQLNSILGYEEEENERKEEEEEVQVNINKFVSPPTDLDVEDDDEPQDKKIDYDDDPMEKKMTIGDLKNKTSQMSNNDVETDGIEKLTGGSKWRGWFNFNEIKIYVELDVHKDSESGVWNYWGKQTDIEIGYNTENSLIELKQVPVPNTSPRKYRDLE